ncbi:MAG: hypothetical protein AABY18_07005 [Candidatus Thermoplasmatota archaeon]
MTTWTDSAQAELLGVLADVLHEEDWGTCIWLGPEAWQACPLEVAGGLWLEGNHPLALALGPAVAQEMERRYHGEVEVVLRERPGPATILVWYRHLN